MAKKKSLKAKLAKKAKSAVDSPSRTNSPAEPEPSTSKGSTEQTSKEKTLLGPNISSIKNRPLLRRDPAVSKKAKKFVKDPRLIPRIMEHLENHKSKNFVSIPLIAEELQKRYPEYARKKKSIFMQYVDRAYSIIADPGSEDSEIDTSDDSNDEGFFPPEQAKKRERKKMKKAITDIFNGKNVDKFGKLVPGSSDIVVPDIDDMPDDESYVPYQDTNAINNMMSNMYRSNASNKRPAGGNDEPPSKQPCVEEKKFVEKIMYPSPDVLKKLKKDSPAPEPKESTTSVYTKITTERYYIDKTGTTTSSGTATTTTVTNVTSGTTDSRETNIQKFLGNLPSRVAVQPVVPRLPPLSTPPARPVPPTVHHPVIQDQELVVPSGLAAANEPSPSRDQKRATARQRYLDRARYYPATNENSTGTPARPKRGAGGSQTQKDKGPEVQQSNVKFADVGGNDSTLKEICKLLVHMRHPEVYRQLGVTPPRGFLLHGPPGCGKTLLANAIAGELELPFIKIAATEIVSGVSGNSEEKIRGLFDKAIESAPCILFIDEIDSITPKRETASKEMERRIVSQLLSCMDDLNTQSAQVLIIGATNRPDSLDPALRRAGRFDREISLGIPDEKARMKILEVLCRDLRLTSDFDYRYLAHNTPGFVGADLMALTREAAMTAVNRVFSELQTTRVPHKHIIISEAPASPDVEPPAQPVTSKQTDSNKQPSNQSSICNSETVSQSDKNNDSAKNLLTWTQQQNASDLKGVTSSKSSVSQPNGISDSQSDLSRKGLYDSDFRTKNGTNNTGYSSEVQYDNIPEDETVERPISPHSRELLSVLSWLKEHPPLTQDQLKDLFISLEDFEEALKHVQPSAKREGFATIPDVTWNDIGALHEVREELQLAILAPVRHAEEFQRLGLNRAQGILLAGPPGCGKTLLAKAVANESGINFISVKGPELLNMYVGESEKAVRTVFQRARNSAPCVIFFDELDALCPRRSDSGDSGSSVRVVNQLLTEMDGLEERKQVFIMAATNRPDIIDPAVLRPGRLDKTLYVGLPTVEDRLDILKCITQNGTKPQLSSDITLDDIAKDTRCEGYTGADLAALVREASIAALKQAISKGPSHYDVLVSKQHFETAYPKVKPSVSEKDKEKYKIMRTSLAV